jgi:putative transposase
MAAPASAGDNALAGSFCAWIKGELLDLQPWPTRAAARRAVVEYIAWYYGTRRPRMATRRRR